MKKRLPFVVFVLGGLLVSGEGANASLIVEGVAPAASDAAASKTPSRAGDSLWGAPSVVEVGSGVASVVQGFGHELRLLDASKMIIPDGWRVFASPKVDPELKVSWSGRVPWTAALSNALRDKGIQATVDWNNKVVAFDQLPVAHVAQPKVSGKANNPAQPKMAVTASEATAARIEHEKQQAAKEVGTPPTEQQWSVAAGVLISASVEAWGNSSQPKWRVFWRAHNWTPDAGAKFYGSFNKAINDLVEAAGKQGSHIKADFFGNHVVVISSVN